jgi:hypothetical protein
MWYYKTSIISDMRNADNTYNKDEPQYLQYAKTTLYICND